MDVSLEIYRKVQGNSCRSLPKKPKLPAEERLEIYGDTVVRSLKLVTCVHERSMYWYDEAVQS